MTKKKNHLKAKQKKKIPHKVLWIIFLPQKAFQTNQIRFQPSAMSERIHKCSPQSLCPCRPLLVHADEGGERQDQVPAGQRDVRTSCAPVGRGVGRCGQRKQEKL